MFRVVAHPGQRHLVRAPRARHLHAVHLLRAGPPLGRAQDDQRPPRPAPIPPAGASLVLDGADPAPGVGQCRCEAKMHAGQVGSLHLQHVVTVAPQQPAHLGRVLAGQHRRAGDLRAVQVQDRQDGAVTFRVEERHALPRPLQRPGLGLAVAHHRHGQQVGVVHDGAEGVHQHVPQLAALVDRAGGGHRDVAGDAARAGELPEQPRHPGLVLTDVRVDLAVGPLQVAGGHQRRPAVPGPGEVDRLLPGVPDEPGDVRVDQRQSRAGAPVAQQPRFDVPRRQRLAEQRIAFEVDLPDREVVGGPPPGVQLFELLGCRGGQSPQRVLVDGLADLLTRNRGHAHVPFSAWLTGVPGSRLSVERHGIPAVVTPSDLSRGPCGQGRKSRPPQAFGPPAGTEAPPGVEQGVFPDVCFRPGGKGLTSLVAAVLVREQ